MKLKTMLITLLLPMSCFATWSSVNTLSSSGFDATQPRVAINGSGDGVAVWREWDGSNTVIMASLFSGGSWDTSVQLSTTSTDSGNCDVDIDSNGNAVATWSQFDGVTIKIKGIVYSSSLESWGSIQNLSGNGADFPFVSMNSIGDAMVIWVWNNGSEDVIKGIDYTSGSWGDVEQISSSGQHAEAHSIKYSDNGNALAIWKAYNGFNFIIKAANYDSGTWGTPEQISDSGKDSDAPQISVNTLGDAMATWIGVGESEFWQVQVAEFVNGSWGSAVIISSDEKSPSQPDIGYNDDGLAVVAWDEYDETDLFLMSANYDGASWSSPVSINPLVQENDNGPDIVLNNSDHALVIWNDYNESNNYVARVATFQFGGSWSSPTTLSASGQDAFQTHVDLNDSGQALTAWSRFDGSNFRIQSSTGSSL